MRVLFAALLFSIGLLLIGFGSLKLYQNLINTGNYYGYGHGQFIVTACQSSNQEFVCTGDFRQYGGMIEANNVTLKSRFNFTKADRVDVYAHYLTKDTNNLNSQNINLETATYRRSLANNAKYLAGCILGLMVSVTSLIYLVQSRAPKDLQRDSDPAE